jgi:GTP-binding protein
VTVPLPSKPIDPPTLSVTFRINDGPLAGREGDKVQSRVIRERLMREAEGNVAIRVTEGEDNDSFDVAGRGELQLAVLIENMRREGFELTIGRPKVVIREENGQRLEPIEEVIIDVDDEHTGVIVQKLTERKGELVDMRPSGVGRQRLRFYVPTRSLIGYQPELLSDTRGTAIFNRLFHEYAPYKGALPGRRTGVLISNGTGTAVPYALWNLEDRGFIMIDPGDDIYEGMIVGEHSRENDLEVNALKGKQLTNIRTTSKDEAVRLTPPKRLTLEQSLGYIADDEFVEVTPKSIRLRKIWLDPNDRKKMMRAAKAS